MQKTLLTLLITIALVACKNNTANTPENDTTTVIQADTVPVTRAVVSNKPAASFNEKVPDELNDWKFSVEVYETKNTFEYIAQVQYKEVRTSDKLTIPDLGIMPKIEIHKGNTPLSCIIGFADKKGQFMPYKAVYVKNEQLKISTLNYYRVGKYRTAR